MEKQREIRHRLESQIDAATSIQRESAAELSTIDALPAALLQEVFGSAGAVESESEQEVLHKLPKGIFFKRGAIAAYIIDRLHAVKTFGRVHLEKNLFLAETYVGVDLAGQYKREAAGPLDANTLYKLENLAARQGWFTKHKRGAKGFFYRPGNAIGNRLDAAVNILGEKKTLMDRLLDITGKCDTEQVEIIATLFAAWNDRLLKAEQADDALIIRDVREHWHISKQRFTQERLGRALDWMRKIGLIPTGMGTCTRGGTKEQ